VKKDLEFFLLLILERMATENKQKNSNNYYCNICDFTACKKNNYEIHLQTQKHLRNTLATTSNIETANFKFKCDNCNKTYNDRTGLWRHKKNCKLEKNDIVNKNISPDVKDNETQELKELMKYLMKENSDMKNMMMKVIENGTHNTTNTNSHNKSFNLNMFLNETCKNAMNITDFVDSLKLQISDLENVGEVGYIEGISSIIIKNLNAMDISERPIHCTDKKRETMYIRDEDKWEKEDEKKAKLHKMVKNVAYKNINLISDFQELHPDWKKINSKYSDQINKIIIESMGGKGDNEYEKEEKIIKRVAKEVFVDK
jgi:transposase-like protein